MADLYPKVQESLKFLADQHVILKDPLSSTDSLFQWKNHRCHMAIGDQLINDKSTNDEPGKLNGRLKFFSHCYHVSSSGGKLFTYKYWGYADVYELVLPKDGKTELTQADLEGQAYEVVKPFYPDVVHLQFKMEECHKMLTYQID
ncbi:hypothetical protein Tco_0975183 [Tanacetum coccineum]|uniref:Uncharacterized protein n=1 Tax=Tanacetum coccineum TaxID=301880 RepID=A0ABQ5EDT7_9ASTR